MNIVDIIEKKKHGRELTKEEINEMLDVSDKIAHQAYSKMQMDSVEHFWARHTLKEVDLKKALEFLNPILDKDSLGSLQFTME